MSQEYKNHLDALPQPGIAPVEVRPIDARGGERDDAAVISTARQDRRILMYSHDTFGLGHLQRCLKISRALVSACPNLSILIVTGSPLVHRFELPPSVDYVKLPAVRKVGPEQYEARSMKMSHRRILALRTGLLLQAVKEFGPHLVLVDHSPRGMKGEMLPALEWLRRTQSDCTTVLGLRDVIDDPAKVVDLWKREGIYGDLHHLYDHILVYGSRDVYDTTGVYGFSPELEGKTTYCNYVVDPMVAGRIPHGHGDSGSERLLVTVTIGGGDGAGEQVIGTYLEMVRKFQSEIEFDSMVITGPFIGAELFEKLRQASIGLPVRLEKFVANTTDYFGRSDLVISTGGYNTVTELLSHARRAILIPRVMHRQEQLIRATRMAEMGLVSCVHPDDVTPAKLYHLVTSLLSSPKEPLTLARERQSVHLDGTSKISELFGHILSGKSIERENPDD